jgi:hypothetical protein
MSRQKATLQGDRHMSALPKIGHHRFYEYGLTTGPSWISHTFESRYKICAGGFARSKASAFWPHALQTFFSQNDFLHCSSNKDLIKHRDLRACPDHIRTAAFDGSREILQAFQAEIDDVNYAVEYKNLPLQDQIRPRFGQQCWLDRGCSLFRQLIPDVLRRKIRY